MKNTYLAINESLTKYPEESDCFSPSQLYPENPWPTSLSRKVNDVYELVRQCFSLSGYDREHFGTKEWNPLGQILTPGNTVLVKPNWVEDKNKNKMLDDPLTCLVTHPSVIRAIIDYVVIALKGTGKIIIGDAPMQGCNLQHMLSIAGYDKLFAFYKKQGIAIEIADLRKYKVSDKYNGVFSIPESVKNTWGSCLVNLESKSMHAENDKKLPNYKVSDYKCADTQQYHHSGNHIYEINQLALAADVIINVPKPKTHRLAGMTGAQKNFVGITYEKACLPHRVEGDKSHGGDSYLKKSIWKEWMNKFDEKRTHCSMSGKYISSKWNDIMMKACYVIGAFTSRDKYRIGSWYGNDTIWRTVADLNYCLLYADKHGKICNTPQRKILTIGDMIICGEKEGPIGPSPKPLGMIMMSEGTLAFDRAMCEIMGFTPDCLPAFKHVKALRMFGYEALEALEQETIDIYQNGIHHYSLAAFTGKKEWRFEAHSCWKGHIEKNREGQA